MEEEIMAFKITKLPEQSEETALQSGLRNVARAGAKVATTVAGFPGDIGALGVDAAHYLSKGASALGKKFGIDIEESPSYAQYKEQNPQEPPITSEELFQVLNKKTGGYLEPKHDIEKNLDSFITNVTTLALPGSVGLKKAAKLALGGEAAGWAFKNLGFGEGAQEGIKQGVIFASQLRGGRKALEKLKEQSYKNAKELLPSNATVKVPDLHEFVNNGLKDIAYTADITKKPIKTRLHQLGNMIRHGSEVSVNELEKLKRGINEEIYNGKLTKLAKKNLIEINDKVKKSIASYGSKNPEWFKNYITSDELYSALKKSEGITQFLGENSALKKTLKNALTGKLLWGGITGSGLISPEGALGAAGAKALYSGYNLGTLLIESPTARKYYMDALAAAANGQKLNFVKSARKLDQIISHDQKKKSNIK
jgi:hypothetical protein